MLKKLQNYTAPNLLCICVDGHRDTDISGRIYYGSGEEPEFFSCAGQMMMEIDALCDRLGFPQAATAARSFGEKKAAANTEEAAMEKVRPEIITTQNGKEATFVVHVQYRQNATWQGHITWAEKDMSQHFRSALELLKLIDSAMYENDAEYSEDNSAAQKTY